MSRFDYCDICGEYGDLARHQANTKVYEVRLDGEEEWRRMCGDYYPFLEDSTDGPKTAAERLCKTLDNEESHVATENRTVWVRLEGDEGEGQPVQVETRMVPEYYAIEMTPCSNGCGRLTTAGLKCHDCMMAELRVARVAMR